MQPETILKEFGLNDKEIAVYLALIKLGPSPVRFLASKAGVNRGTTYDILKDLITQSLVSYYNKDSHQYFVAEPPEKLVAALEAKQKDLERLKLRVGENLPKLKSIFDHEGGKPVVKFYEGSKGVKQILEDVLTTMVSAREKIYYVYSSATSDRRRSVYKAFPDFSKKRIAKKIRVKTIALGQGGELVGLDERKWLKANEENLKATHEIIYNGKIAHISLDEMENPVGVVIENEAIYSAQKIIFEFSWDKI